MSKLKDAIKSLTTEGTKRRYWPSKNPIDDPKDFPGEQNFGEEENEDTEPFRDHEYNRFRVKELRNALSSRIQKLSGGAFVGQGSVDAAREARFLKWLDSEIEGSGRQSMDRRDFQKIMKDAPGGVSNSQMLDAALPGAKELYADKVGPYGSMRGEEEDEYGRDQGAMHDDGPEYDDDKVYQTQQCASCGGDGCDLCDYSGDFGQWVSTGEENEETVDCHWCGGDGKDEQNGDTPCKYCDGSGKGPASENEEQDVSRFDYVNIIPEKNGKFTVKGYDSFPAHSVLAGQVRKNFLASFDSAEEAEAAFPMAKMSHHMMEPENHFGHLEDEEEDSDCGLCGNTGYSMADGQPCPACDQGKAEKHAQLASEEEESTPDCHQCGNTGMDLGTNKPCDSCPEGDQFRKPEQPTFKHHWDRRSTK